MILITGQAEDDHLRRLHEVLERLESGLRLKQVYIQSVSYLGHQIDAQGLHPLPDKVAAVLEAPLPQDVAQLTTASFYLTCQQLPLPGQVAQITGHQHAWGGMWIISGLNTIWNIQVPGLPCYPSLWYRLPILVRQTTRSQWGLPVRRSMNIIKMVNCAWSCNSHPLWQEMQLTQFSLAAPSVNLQDSCLSSLWTLYLQSKVAARTITPSWNLSLAMAESLKRSSVHFFLRFLFPMHFLSPLCDCPNEDSHSWWEAQSGDLFTPLLTMSVCWTWTTHLLTAARHCSREIGMSPAQTQAHKVERGHPQLVNPTQSLTPHISWKCA